MALQCTFSNLRDSFKELASSYRYPNCDWERDAARIFHCQNREQASRERKFPNNPAEAGDKSSHSDLSTLVRSVLGLDLDFTNHV